MPANVKCRVIAARDLPIMDRASETADAFVEIKFGQTVHKTDIYPKSLNPQWNSDWFKFEAEDDELQDFPVVLRVLDYDMYSANDAIGRVYVDLNPLLSSLGPSQLSGWLPIFDTMNGIRGELNVVVRVELFTDTNRYRESSCGIIFFATAAVPSGFGLGSVQGFVEELIANDDPEHQWIDKIRTTRASNDARQLLFSKMSGELLRKIGKKAFELGGNAVIGYRLCFDLEGEFGIVVRGIGTAVTLIRESSTALQGPLSPPASSGLELWHSPVPENHVMQSPPLTTTPQSLPGVHVVRRRSSTGGTARALPLADLAESSLVSTPVQTQQPSFQSTPNGVHVADDGREEQAVMQLERRLSTSSSSSAGGFAIRPSPCRVLPVAMQVSIDMMEFPFFTMRVFPPGFVVSIGGVVSARSVKLLEKDAADESETRDEWWAEIRCEIRSHMRALSCKAVIGYREQASIYEDVCILSASGTAALVELPAWPEPAVPMNALNLSLEKSSLEKEKEKFGLRIDTHLANNFYARESLRQNSAGEMLGCSPCHIPYSEDSLPFPVKVHTCQECGRGKVPDLLLSTVDLLPGLAVVGEPVLVQSRLVRKKNDATGEAHAKEVSDMLPFVEYELHSQLMANLTAKGGTQNAVFGLRVELSFARNFLIGVATGTACRLACLPTATMPRPLSVNGISAGSVVRTPASAVSPASAMELDLNRDKNTVVVEIDSQPQLDSVATSSSTTQFPAKTRSFTNLLSIPPTAAFANYRQLQLIVRVWRCDLGDENELTSGKLASSLDKLLLNTAFKYRMLKTACLSSLAFAVSIPESSELQVCLFGAVLADTNDSYLGNKRGTSHTPPTASAPIPIAGRAGRRFSTGSARKLPSTVSTATQFEDVLETSPPPTAQEDAFSSSAGALLFRIDDATARHGFERTYSVGTGRRSMPNTTTRGSGTGTSGGISQSLEEAVWPRMPPAQRTANVFLTPLFEADTPIASYLGHYDFFFIRETNTLKEQETGGLSAFVNVVLLEIMCVVRAYVASVGGHGLVAFALTWDMEHQPNRNHAQILASVSGDIVTTTSSPPPP